MPPNGQGKQPRKKKRSNGDGSLYRRRDGKWVGAFIAPTVSGSSRRVVVYGKTRDEARDKMSKAQQDARAGMPVPDEVWKLGPYLEYWLENFVKQNRRPSGRAARMAPRNGPPMDRRRGTAVPHRLQA